MRKHFVVLLSIFLSQISFSQTATVRGVVKDGATGELLESATVLQPPANGTTTNAKGINSLTFLSIIVYQPCSA